MIPSRIDRLLNRLRMRQVALMLAIDEFRTLYAAARHLGMTQPAASKMLHELEDSLGETLFDRVGRGLMLNPAGQAVLNTFRTMRNSMASLERELHELRLGSSGKLLIGSTTYTVSNDLGVVVSVLKEEYPRLSIELSVDTSDRLIELLRDGRLDVVVARMPEPASPANLDCVFTPIGETSLSVVAACNHPLTQAPKKQHLEFQALSDYPWVFQLPGSPIREIVEQEFRSHYAALPPGLMETSSFLATIELIVNSRMIAVIPQSVANRYARHNLLRILPYTLIHTPMPRGSLVHRDRHINVVMRRFLDLMHDLPHS
jgi:DNA-binding transcriptional LysR family regulator